MQGSNGCPAGLTRRRLLRQAVAAGGLLMPALALAEDAAEAAMAAIVAGREVSAGELALSVPAIAENGNTVPVSVAAGGRFTAHDYVRTIHLFAPDNPAPEVISFHFTPRSGLAHVATRIRLARTQQVIAIAELSDGRVWRTAKEVRVTIGGCGA